MHGPILFVNMLVVVLAQHNRGLYWDYNRFGPEVWADSYPSCSGRNQSPINIKTACTIYKDFEPFHFSFNHNAVYAFHLRNDGHTITSSYSGTPMTLTGGSLNGHYMLENFHIHWGPNKNVGSEHQVNGMKYTGECHFVYKHMNKSDQLAVLGFFMKSVEPNSIEKEKIDPARLVRNTNEWLEYFNASQTLPNESDTSSVNLTIFSLMGGNLKDFWRYSGSLTTPPCSEIVTWTVFKDPIYILDVNFETFRDELFFESYRGPQSLYYRQVYRSHRDEASSDIPDQQCCTNRPNKGTGTSLSLNEKSVRFYLFYISFITLLLFY